MEDVPAAALVRPWFEPGHSHVMPKRQTDSQGKARRLPLQGLRRGFGKKEEALPAEESEITAAGNFLLSELVEEYIQLFAGILNVL
jgi:hypothetical protein